MRHIMIPGLFLTLGWAFACGGERQQAPEPEQATPDAPRAPAAEQTEADPRQERAMAAIFELRDTLMGRVMSVAEQDGFPAAVTVCHEEAIPLTQQVADKHDLRIGRTSERLRNPDNTAPAWFDDVAEQATDAPHFTVAETGELRGAAPIRLAAPCMSCHGPQDALADGVAEVLEVHYPQDRATGYTEGDLRGFFWVEVPN